MSKIIMTFFMSILFFIKCIQNEYITQTPIVFVIICDQSKSAENNQVPKLTESDINTMLNLVLTTGGSLCYLPLTANSFVPITRLELEPLYDKTLKQKAILRKKQLQKIDSFKQKVFESIKSERSAIRTDLWGGINRVNRLFQEITINNKYRKYCLLVSDGIDDAKKYPPTALQSDVKAILVGIINEQVKQEIGGQVVEFEGLDAAIKYIINSTKGGKNGNI